MVADLHREMKTQRLDGQDGALAAWMNPSSAADDQASGSDNLAYTQLSATREALSGLSEALSEPSPGRKRSSRADTSALAEQARVLRRCTDLSLNQIARRLGVKRGFVQYHTREMRTASRR